MAPQTAKSLIKEFRASFRRKKTVDSTPKTNVIKEADEEELAKLLEMKESLGDQLPPLYSDATLLSFLRARSLNVKEAEKLLKLDVNVKRLLCLNEYSPPEELVQYSFTGMIGFDKEGCLVRITDVGGTDIKGLVNMISTVNGLKTVLWMIHRDIDLQEQENKKTGRKATRFVYILNLENLTMGQISYKPVFDSAMQALKLLQDHYHDALKLVYFINAPSFFSSVFKLFKPVIKDSLNQKIKIFDHAGWKEELLKEIDADVLPKFLGGNRVDSKGDPKCTEFISFGGKQVPQICYAKNFLDLKDPDVVVTTVQAGATLNFRFPIRELGSIMKWHIQAKDNDIGFALYREPFPSGTETPRTRKKREEDMSKFEQMTPIIRSQCHISPEEGSTTLWFTGNLILHFDNTYSWMNSKEVAFKFSIRPPTESEKNLFNSSENAARALSKMAISK